MNLVRLARVSLAILMAHRARTLVSFSAVFVGVASLVLMLGAGQAAQRDLSEQISEMGGNILVVHAGEVLEFGRRVQQASRATTLSLRDVETLRRQVVGVHRLSGLALGSKPVRWRTTTQNIPVLGVEPSYFELQRLGLRQGRLFTAEEEGAQVRVAILGAKVARDLFEFEDPIGRRVRVAAVPFEVIGVAGEKGMGLAGTDPDRSIFMPLSTMLGRLLGRTYLDTILVQAASSPLIPTVRLNIIDVLRRNHRIAVGGPDDFSVQDPAALLAAEHQMGDAYRILMGGVSLISLATGGMGIVAVMLMSVRERTREIGLRRAIGASKRSILVQFLFEGVVLTSFGGGSGAVAGLPANALVCRLAGWPIVWPTTAMVGAIVFSVGLGLLCGVVPAIRAARMEPALAIRAAI